MKNIVYNEIKSVENEISESVTRRKYNQLTLMLIEKKLTITAMESCTSGQIASLITDTEGSSAVIKGSFVTYSNEAKIKMGVSKKIIEEFGVYSSQTCCEMASVCRNHYDADIGIGVTGTFGNPDPDNSDSTPGEVFFAIDTSKNTRCFHCTVPAQKTRFLYKMYIADLIVDVLLKKIK